jgi:hypothetical protein
MAKTALYANCGVELTYEHGPDALAVNRLDETDDAEWRHEWKRRDRT